MKDLDPANLMLGIEIRRDRTKRKIFISQSEYTKEVLLRFNMLNSKHVPTPMEKFYFELVEQKSFPADDAPYRQVVGSLMISSRPDLSFMIGKLSQHAESPSNFHGIALKRTLQYVNSTRDFGILFDGNKPLVVEGFSDADCAGCRTSRESTSGFVFLLQEEQLVGNQRDKPACRPLRVKRNKLLCAWLPKS